ncbi:MAG: sugar transferase [bacterium]
MATINKKDSNNRAFLLFLGDLATLFISLALSLILRYQGLPSTELFLSHLIPFSIIFAASIFIYYVAGLYEKNTLLFKQRVPQTLINVQIVNAVLAVALFYFIPYFAITPKFFLLIYLVIALVLTTMWRMSALSLFETKKHEDAQLLTTRDGKDIEELLLEINQNTRYGIHLLKSHVRDPRIIVVDFGDTSVHPLTSSLYKLIFSGVQFIDIRELYENVFDRIPMSLVDDSWCLEHISSVPKHIFDISKRIQDIIVSLFFGVASLVFYPFVWIAIKLDDGGVIFSYQTRVGQQGKLIKVAKFRTMSVANDEGQWAEGEEKPKNKITRVGAFLRKSRIDELPQLWNVLKGEISLIGPRPEFPDAVSKYSETIPYYNLRHIVKPGLSGWAQIYHENHPHHGLDHIETQNKLSYDLYYIKNRSILLDIKIALRTLKVLISFAGK